MRNYLRPDEIHNMSYFDFKMYVKLLWEKEEEKQKQLAEQLNS
jgi:predicted transcriptional regulator